LLLGYVDQQRAVLHFTAYGLTDEQARTPAASASPLTVGGLVKHVAKVEQNWIDLVLGRERPATAEADYIENFTMRSDETLADVIDAAVAIGEETTPVTRGMADPANGSPGPPGCRLH